MIKRATVLRLLVCGAIGLVLSACQQTSSREGDRAQRAGNNAVPDRVAAATNGESLKSAETGPQTIEPTLASPGKPLPPIGFDYTIVGAPVIGQPLEIRLRASVPSALAELNLALSGSERLFVPPESLRLRVASSTRDAPRVETIHVTPLSAGRHYVSILLQAEIDGRLQSRSVTIPIDVDGVPAEPVPAGTVSTDASGERIISLPGRND